MNRTRTISPATDKRPPLAERIWIALAILGLIAIVVYLTAAGYAA